MLTLFADKVLTETCTVVLPGQAETEIRVQNSRHTIQSRNVVSILNEPTAAFLYIFYVI
jgi:hypothetical protein